MQLIDGHGKFNVSKLDTFINETKFAKSRLSYAVIAILGPQSSGKSTLLNKLFNTDLREMDSSKGSSQTTQGIWIAKCDGIEPFTIAMDVEGTDGKERGQDDIAFEKQSALFALAIADIVLINMWCHDVGRENGANKPLLRTVFEVMTHLFLPRKTMLVFVLRDKNKIPFESLERSLTTDIEKLWNEVPKHQDHINTPLSRFFNVAVIALSNYEDKEEMFIQEVAQLKNRLSHSISPKGLAADRQGVLPASAFLANAQQVWKVIKENKTLNLPTLKKMIANVQCEENANEKLSRFNSDEDWLYMKKAVETCPVPDFGKRLSSILQTYISKYDTEALYFDADVRNAKRMQLKTNIVNVVQPAYNKMLGHLHSGAVETFKTMLDESLSCGIEFDASVATCYNTCMQEFDEGCEDATIKELKLDASAFRKKLHQDTTEYANLSKIFFKMKTKLAEKLCEKVNSLIKVGGKDTWIEIRELVKHETANAVLEFSSEINKAGIKSNQSTVNSMMQNFRIYARNLVELMAKHKSENVVQMMADRFKLTFNLMFDQKSKFWTRKKSIEKIAIKARIKPLKLLSIIAVIRLDENELSDDIEKEILSSFPEWNSGPSPNLCSNRWKNVSENNTVITPEKCNDLWEQFKNEVGGIVSQAHSKCKEVRNKNGERATWALLSSAVLATKFAIGDRGGCADHAGSIMVDIYELLRDLAG